MNSRVGHWSLVFALLLVVGCSQKVPAPQVKIDRPSSQKIEKLTTRHLPNSVRVYAKVISGGLPAGLPAFEELRSLGVKTVISVDAALPDLVSAENCGLRYVHLPHGYDGIPATRAAELAKAVRDLPGPIYIHCHHGKHRSPAAAATACVAAGLIDHSAALTVLQIAGTSPHYRGLFESTESAEPLDQALLDQLHADFPAAAKLPAMAEAMVALEQTHEHLKAFEKAGWKQLPGKPDLTPEHEALLLREHYAELLRSEVVQQQPDRFRQLLTEAEIQAHKLEDGLRAWNAASAASAAERLPDTIPAALQAINDNCQTCHQAFRDVPLSQKGVHATPQAR